MEFYDRMLSMRNIQLLFVFASVVLKHPLFQLILELSGDDSLTHLQDIWNKVIVGGKRREELEGKCLLKI